MRYWDRCIAAATGLVLAANGVFMLAASAAWYQAVPGVPSTGPFNPHFIKDIGAIYVVCAAALGWFAWRPRQGWTAMAVAAAWLVLHAAVHLRDASCGGHPLPDVQRDLFGIYVLAAIPTALAILRRPKGA